MKRLLGKAFGSRCGQAVASDGLASPFNRRKRQQRLLAEEQTGPECRNAKGTMAFHKTNLAFEQ